MARHSFLSLLRMKWTKRLDSYGGDVRLAEIMHGCTYQRGAHPAITSNLIFAAGMIIARIALSSEAAIVWPKKLHEPNSDGLDAPLIGYNGSH